MTKIVTYKCNLCHSDFSSDAGSGVYFVMNDLPDFRHPNQAENHLCNTCINGLKKVFKAQEPPRDTSWDNFKPGDMK